MKDKINQTKVVTKKVAKNAEDLINAVALSTTTVFSGYSAYTNRGKLMFVLLGVAAAWSLIQAFVAWSKVLNK